MAFVKVPKDLTKVKNKILFNLTKRQLICFALAGVVGIPFYLFIKRFTGTDIAAILMITLMLPFFLLALYEKDGMHLETMIRNYIRVKYIYPPTRPFRSENQYQLLQEQVKGKGEIRVEQKPEKEKRKKAGNRKAGKQRKRL